MTRALRQELHMSRAFASPEHAAYVGLAFTADALKGRVVQLLKQHGLSEPQFNLLRIVRGAGAPIASLEAASRMLTRLPDITRLVDRLEAAELLERTRCPDDRRVVHLQLTERGGELLASLEEPLHELLVQLLGHMTRRELKDLGGLLDRARAKVVRDQE